MMTFHYKVEAKAALFMKSILFYEKVEMSLKFLVYYLR